MNYPRAFANSVVLPERAGRHHGWADLRGSVQRRQLGAQPGDCGIRHTGTFTRHGARGRAPQLPLGGDAPARSAGCSREAGGLCGTCSTNHPDGQIFSPPYLFNADGSLRTRPTIASAPTTASTGQTITVTTGGPVSQFSMVRYGESTHSVDNDQRRIPLSIVSSSGNTYQLAIPSDPGVALPGPYMLFALDASGTPSVSSTISITNVATQPPSNPYGQAVFADGPSAYWPLNDTGGSTAADLSGNGDTAITSAADSPTSPQPGRGNRRPRRHPQRLDQPDRGLPADHESHHLLRGDVVQDHHHDRRHPDGLRTSASGRRRPAGTASSGCPTTARSTSASTPEPRSPSSPPLVQRRKLAPGASPPRGPTACTCTSMGSRWSATRPRAPRATSATGGSVPRIWPDGRTRRPATTSPAASRTWRSTTRSCPPARYLPTSKQHHHLRPLRPPARPAGPVRTSGGHCPPASRR